MSRKNNYHFKIITYRTHDEILDCFMSFVEARKFLDSHSSDEQPLTFRVFNDKLNRWELSPLHFVGGRRVYDNESQLYIIDNKYLNLRKSFGKYDVSL